jgi:hypothetical protein
MQRHRQIAVNGVHFGSFQLRRQLKGTIDIKVGIGRPFLEISKSFREHLYLTFRREIRGEKAISQTKLKEPGMLLFLHCHVEPNGAQIRIVRRKPGCQTEIDFSRLFFELNKPSVDVLFSAQWNLA